MTRRTPGWLSVAAAAAWLTVVAAAPGASPQLRPATPGSGAPRPSAIDTALVRPVVAAPSTVTVGIAGPGGYSIRAMEIEEYVAGVLTGEAARDSDPEVLQALAVAIRTYALKNLSRHRSEGFDVCDETHCQVLRRPTAASTSAATRTAGQVLTWRGALAIVYYSASCGGHSQIPSAVWPGAEDPPYLPARPDDGCGGTPEWDAAMRTEDIERTLRRAGFRGSLKLITVASRDRSGRVTRLALQGMRPSTIGGPELRMALGPTQIKSTAFEVDRQGTVHAFAGRGYGHGVGMCVIGATRLAARGETAEALLARYYPGTTIGTISGSRVPPVVTTAAAAEAPAADAGPSGRPAAGAAPTAGIGDRTLPVVDHPGEVAALAATARAQLAATLAVAPSGPLPIVLHATDDAYERATGRHWFSLAALVRGELHLMPIEQLRLRGVLDRVVRREVVHGLIDASLSARPQWVRDGLALHFADPQVPDSDSRGACPTDAELTQPVSAGALAQAYARARSCVARQLNSGRAWRDVR